MLSAASDKAKFFGKSFSKNLRLDESCICLPAFPSVNNLKLHNRLVTSKFAKKVITNFDSSKGSGPVSISVVVLKNCDSELFYILGKLFNICLKESCFLDCCKA